MVGFRTGACRLFNFTRMAASLRPCQVHDSHVQAFGQVGHLKECGRPARIRHGMRKRRAFPHFFRFPWPWWAGRPPSMAKKEPGPGGCRGRALFWRRPTLAGPIVPLPSALRRFTSGFGMGPGGSTTLWSPEGDPGVNGGVPFIPIPGLWGPGLCYTLLVIGY